MTVKETDIQGLLIIQPSVFTDDRGYFFEAYNEQHFQELGIKTSFVQDNISKSKKGVLRGLHFQNPPYAQGKMVQVLQGAVLDVAVDLRSNSPTYGKHFSLQLSEENKTLLYIPEGFAHGFVVLEDNTIFSYKCTNYYHKDSESSIFWNDKDLNIDWGINDPLISKKDQEAPAFDKFNSSFKNE